MFEATDLFGKKLVIIGAHFWVWDLSVWPELVVCIRPRA